jgi:hypothetical protein
MKTMNYFRKVYVALLALAVSFTFNSCGDDDDNGDGPDSGVTLEVVLSSTDLVPATGAKIEATVTTTGEWAAQASQQWVTFDPIRGSGNGKFTITVQGHEAQVERDAIVTVSIDGSDVKKTFEIKQDKVQAAFTMTDEGVFADKCKGVKYFWSVWESAPSPALYYKYTVLKKGTFNIKFTNSHIHTFMMNREPGYYDKTGVDATGYPTFPPLEQPTLEMDADLLDTFEQAFGAVLPNDEEGKGGDVPVLCPRDTPQDITFHLLPGTYWTTHTLEGNPLGPDCTDSEEEGKETLPFGVDEYFKITVTFTPDAD